YDTSVGAASEINLFGPSLNSQLGSSINESGISFTNVGFFLKNTVTGSTWFSNTASNVNGTSGDTAGHQHFAIFTTASNPNAFYLGIEDWIWNSGEGINGDYNDIIIRINASVVPEPETFALMGAGLLGIGYIRFRTRKNRA